MKLETFGLKPEEFGEKPTPPSTPQSPVSERKPSHPMVATCCAQAAGAENTAVIRVQHDPKEVWCLVLVAKEATAKDQIRSVFVDVDNVKYCPFCGKALDGTIIGDAYKQERCLPFLNHLKQMGRCYE